MWSQIFTYQYRSALLIHWSSPSNHSQRHSPSACHWCCWSQLYPLRWRRPPHCCHHPMATKRNRPPSQMSWQLLPLLLLALSWPLQSEPYRTATDVRVYWVMTKSLPDPEVIIAATKRTGFIASAATIECKLAARRKAAVSNEIHPTVIHDIPEMIELHKSAGAL